MTPIIEVQNISKQYKIGSQQQSYHSLRESLVQTFKSFSAPKKHSTFLALQDISFSVNQGECLGIIGHNGAGKSTLLKILSQITPPTNGKVILRGRVASLLEVGTGFHPELTGRENIYLNGAILGMQRQEINRKFDEIIDFSGVEQFLDTPLKHFSSGMRLRLAFSVAAHLEPEILLIDEVLAVGDIQFQQKCLGKMNEVAQSGRTILFVSHNLSAVKSLCNRAILLEKGQIKQIGTTDDIIETYTSNNFLAPETQVTSILEKKVFGDIRIDALEIKMRTSQLHLNFTFSGNIKQLSSLIYLIAPVSSERCSLIDLRNDFLDGLAHTTKNRVTIHSVLDMSHYVEGLYQVGLAFESTTAGWHETNKILFELIKQQPEGYFYEAKYRGLIETPATNNIKFL